MYIAQILYPVKVLGPGNRIGIWFSGCHHKCEGCSNPELWGQPEKYKTSSASLLKMIDSIVSTREVTGFTLTGGDPFEQPESLRELLPLLNRISKDIIIYSGFTLNELKEKGYQDILSLTGVLIDGKYIKERNNNCFLRGSDNQTIHILNKELNDFYKEYINKGINQVQNFRTKTGFVSVGIHRAEYREELPLMLKKKGIRSTNHG